MEVPLAVGKESLCNICLEPFILSELTLRLIRPHCINCGRREIRDSNGKKHYVSKKTGKPDILSTIAQDSTTELKERLAKITTYTLEEDI